MPWHGHSLTSQATVHSTTLISLSNIPYYTPPESKYLNKPRATLTFTHLVSFLLHYRSLPCFPSAIHLWYLGEERSISTSQYPVASLPIIAIMSTAPTKRYRSTLIFGTTANGVARRASFTKASWSPSSTQYSSLLIILPNMNSIRSWSPPARAAFASETCSPLTQGCPLMEDSLNSYTKHALATALHLEVRGIPENQNEWETDGPNPDIYVHDGENTLGAFSSCEPLMKRLTSDECGLVSPFDAEFRAASLVRFTGQDHPFYAPRLEESQLGALRGRCVLALGKYMKEITWFRFLGVAWPMKELVGDPSLKGKLTWYSPKTSIQQFMNLAPPPN
ncbi:hypothetical protein F5Y15DRAFT_228486 [Xylariaceae sp. FL0016]|nr:hypothetical protein F5Y15DRAFT_228486 [Xylariaceae sp. FL0016]